MENYITIIASAVLSGIIATIITLWWQNRNEKNKMRREIFTTLMAYRFKISHAESVKALNCVQAVFYDCPDVQNAWKKFKEAVDAFPVDTNKITDSHITLLEEIAKVLKYKALDWKDIKTYYYPEALAQEINDSTLLRKAQLKVAQNDLQQNSSTNVNQDTGVINNE